MERFNKFPHLLVVCSDKRDGDLRLGDGIENTAKEARNNFFKKVGIDPEDTVTAGLAAGMRVKLVGEKDRGKIIPETDGLVTAERGVFLSVTAADCLPLFFYDPVQEAVAIAHAGWQGLSKVLLPNIVGRMQEELGCRPMDMLAAIGPAIGECHYEVREDVAREFADFPSAVTRKRGKIFLNLKKVALLQLRSAGVLGKNVEVHPACTFCEKDTYFSYRRDRPEKVQAMLALIGLP